MKYQTVVWIDADNGTAVKDALAILNVAPGTSTEASIAATIKHLVATHGRKVNGARYSRLPDFPGAQTAQDGNWLLVWKKTVMALYEQQL
jgi:hypothetical protein